ncbi:MAG: HAMP domain-containing histidine kinase [Polyangiaceae bacterium]|nr:HAMP domain-containing histidine kinase [Polyangiaceae bacterium]
MKLAVRLAAMLTVALAAILAFNGYSRVERELEVFDEDDQRDHETVGRALGSAVEHTWRAEGEAGVRALLERASHAEHGLRARLVWLDAPAEDPGAPLVPGVTTERVARGMPLERVPDGRDGLLVSYVPVRGVGRPAAVELAESGTTEHEYLRTTVRRTLVSSLVLVAACGVIVLAFGAAFVGRPLAELVAHARRVGAGDLGSRARAHGHHEIGVLAAEMNAMAGRLGEAHDRAAAEMEERIRAVEQLRHADRLGTVGKLASGVAHELGTPLNVIAIRAKMIEQSPTATPETSEAARIVREQAARMAAIIRQLLDFARRRKPHLGPMELVPLVGRVCAMLEPMARKRGVALELRPSDRVRVAGDAALVEQVVTNLCVNAVQASPSGSPVTLSVTRARVPPVARAGAGAAPPTEHACIEVQDRGTGMTPEVREHAFEPFFTTKEVGEGTGLGLSVSFGIVEEHGGWIEVDSEPGRGSTFRVWLPALPAEGPSDEATA